MSADRIDALTDEVGDLAAAEAAKVDERGEFPMAALTALRHTRLLGLMVPAEFGGLGGGPADLVRVTRRLARGCLSTALVFTMHSQQVETIARHGGTSLRARLLPAIAAGEVYLASVTTERSGGGHLLSSAETIVSEDDGWSLRRDAPIVTGGRHADGFLIKTGVEEAVGTGVSLVYADRDQLTVETGAPWRSMGMRGVENVSMTLTGTVPADQLVGAPGGFRAIAVETFAPAAHLGWSAAWLGAACGGLSTLVGMIRAGDRTVRVNGRSELAAHRLARIRARLEAVGAYLHTAVEEVTSRRARGETLDRPAVQIHLNTLKVLAAEHTHAAVDEMITLAGMRAGYLTDSPVPLERLSRDLRSASLNYDDARLLAANGALSLFDAAVTLLGD